MRVCYKNVQLSLTGIFFILTLDSSNCCQIEILFKSSFQLGSPNFESSRESLLVVYIYM